MRPKPMDSGPDPRWKIARSFARFAIDLPFQVLLSETASIPVTTGRMRDISLGGLGGALESDVRVGQRVWVEFRLPGANEATRLLCRVCHGNLDRFGFEFLNITPQQRDAIRQACQDRRMV